MPFAYSIPLYIQIVQGRSPLATAIARRRERPPAVAIVVGNDGAGASERLEAAAAVHVGIPLAREAESLNVGVAAGILLYEVLRGR